MPAQELGGAVDHEVRAERQRPLVVEVQEVAAAFDLGLDLLEIGGLAERDLDVPPRQVVQRTFSSNAATVELVFRP
jgi:hypothetical protein